MSTITTESVSGVDLVIPDSLAIKIDPNVTDVVMAVPEGTCVQCNASKRSFTKSGIRFATVTIDKNDEEMRNFILEVTGGVTQLPFVINAHDVKNFWSGFNPTEIDSLKSKAIAA